jgi:hypothetical protein
MNFMSYLRDRHNGREPNTPWMSKTKMSEFAAKLGLRVPKTLAAYDNAEELSFDGLPDRFVIKPTEWWSMRGVMVLVRDGDRFYDRLHKLSLTAEEIRREQRKHQLEWKLNNNLCRTIVEEMIVDEGGPDLIPFDYKCYTFDGDVRFIDQDDRNGTLPRVAFYYDDFCPMPISRFLEPKFERIELGPHRVPKCWEAILDAASKLSIALETPFVRVDMYASDQGPVVGELTPTPGPPLHGMWTFQRWYDEELGRAWSRAAARLNR